jgi:proline iminopeptidase
MLAILSDGSRVKRLSTIKVPTLVIHGVDDPLVPLAAGKPASTPHKLFPAQNSK